MDEMAGWHHWLDGRESEWTPGVDDGQGGLACCDSWGYRELDTTERLNWTELMKVNMKVVHSYLTLCNLMDSTVHGILQARILEWVAFPFSQLRDSTLQADSLPAEPQGKPNSYDQALLRFLFFGQTRVQVDLYSSVTQSLWVSFISNCQRAGGGARLKNPHGTFVDGGAGKVLEVVFSLLGKIPFWMWIL